jgi:Toprim-like
VTEGSKRYLQVPGGSNGLYLAQSLQLKRPVVVLTEGEFDALSLAQECGDLVAVVATGTTKGSHTPRWISLLAQQKRVLVAFDAERDKGAMQVQQANLTHHMFPSAHSSCAEPQPGGCCMISHTSGLTAPRMNMGSLSSKRSDQPMHTSEWMEHE